MDLVVAEKPSVARDLARVLGAPRRGDWFENDRYAITWCIGHLVELEEPAAYDPAWKAWRLASLPMLPSEFRITPSKHARDQLRTVRQLLRDRRFASAINACDAGREGELIFRYVHQYAESPLPVRRLWISSLTDDAIRRGFAALRPGQEFGPLADAARSRSEADWLVGMNATRAVTVAHRGSGSDTLFSIGRVQTPTLALIVAREREIRSFVARPYWEVHGELRTAGGAAFRAVWRDGARPRLATAELADAIVARDRVATELEVAAVRARTVREAPPQLFDLTSLQRTANRRFGWSAARTLELAQALYERHKVITYPRTDSRHLSTDVACELPALFAALVALPDLGGFAQHLVDQPPRPGRRIVDDAKVSDHHAIIPTGAIPRGLDRDEARLFDLIARRFLGAFYPDAEIAVTEAWIRVGAGQGPAPAFEAVDRDHFVDALPPPPDHYFARGRVRVRAGWQEVAGLEADRATRDRDDRGDRDDQPTGTLPPLASGQRLAGAFTPVAKHTTPPPRFTEATLLAAMESAGKQIDDEELRAAMKDVGLGTPATRASIIETLLKRTFIAREQASRDSNVRDGAAIFAATLSSADDAPGHPPDGGGRERSRGSSARKGSEPPGRGTGRQVLVPTATGIELIEALAAARVSTLASPELTGNWEARLSRIARGEESRAAFMADIARYVTSVIDAIRGTSSAFPPSSPPPRSSSPPPRTPLPPIPALLPRAPAVVPPIPGSSPAPDRSRTEMSSPDRSRGGSETGAPAPDRSRAEMSSPDRPRGGAEMGAPAPDRSPETGSPAPNRPRGGSETGAPARDRRSRETGSPAPNRPRASSDTEAPAANRPRARAEAGSPKEPRASLELAAQLPCPRCRQGRLIAGQRGWGCERWRDGCRFVIWFQTAGRRLTDVQLRALIEKGKTRKAKFVDARGNAIEARLVLDPASAIGVQIERV